MVDETNNYPYIVAVGDSNKEITHFFIEIEKHLIPVSEKTILKRISIFILFFFNTGSWSLWYHRNIRSFFEGSLCTWIAFRAKYQTNGEFLSSFYLQDECAKFQTNHSHERIKCIFESNGNGRMIKNAYFLWFIQKFHNSRVDKCFSYFFLYFFSYFPIFSFFIHILYFRDFCSK